MEEKMAFSVADTAEVLGVSRPTVYKLIRRDDFPVFRVGTRTLIPRSGLEKWIRDQSEARG